MEDVSPKPKVNGSPRPVLELAMTPGNLRGGNQSSSGRRFVTFVNDLGAMRAYSWRALTVIWI